MQITQVIEGDTLLAYSLTTAPVPLQASPASGDPAIASLMVVISAPVDLGEVTVTQVAFKLPIGDAQHPDAADLTEVPGSINPSVSDPAWTFARGAATNVYLLKPQTGATGVINRQGIAVTLNRIQVSPMVGTARVTIIELASAVDRPAQPRQSVIAVPKFPPGFFAGNFTAEKPLVANGEPAVLTWSGSADGLYTILWATHSRVVSDLRRWVSPPLTEATTFILQVAPQKAGETVVLYFSATVMVLNPSLVANDLTVLKGSQLKGAATAAELTVQGRSTLANVGVTGTAEVASLVSRALDAQGNSTIANLTVGQGLTARGWVSLLPGATPLNVGSYTAATDGFVFGWVGGGGLDPAKKSWVRIAAEGRFGYVEAVGGNLVLSLADRGWYGPNSGSLILPIRKGDSFWLSRRDWEQNEATPPVAFFWFPLGNPPGAAKPVRQKTSSGAARKKASVPAAGATGKARPADATGARSSAVKRVKRKKARWARHETSLKK